MSTNDDKDSPIQDDSSEIDDKRSDSENKKRPVTLSGSISRSIVAQTGSRFNPLYDKVESEHISQFLKNANEKDAAVRRKISTDRNYALVYFFTFIGIFIFLAIMLLPDNKEIFFNLMKDLGLLIAGGFGGYGLHAYRSGKRDK